MWKPDFCAIDGAIPRRFQNCENFGILGVENDAVDNILKSLILSVLSPPLFFSHILAASPHLDSVH
jgi:hypothetical protein